MTRAVAAEPLFAETPTRAAMPSYPEAPPRAVYLGLGLCTRHRMAAGLPVDVLGMLLPAERLRRAIGAEHLIVLIADAHARSTGFEARAVATRAAAVAVALLRVRAVRGLSHMRILRASALQEEPEYRAVLEAITAAAGREGNPYMHRQTADVAYLDRALGGILKLGWTVDVNGSAGGYSDEVAFDRLVEPWSGRRPAFAYVRCGRAFDDRRPKVSPYVGVDRRRRLYLDPSECPSAKLARGVHIASRRNVEAVREHLARIADAWGAEEDVLDRRLSAILESLYPGRGVAPESLSPRPVSGTVHGTLAVADLPRPSP